MANRRNKTKRPTDEDDDARAESKSIVIPNIYAELPELSPNYIQKNRVILHPARILICGPSGSGKTNLASIIAVDLLHWDTITIYAKNPDQLCFRFLKNYIAEKASESGLNPDDILYISSEIDRDTEDYDITKQNLVIFDDLAARNDKKNGNKILQYMKTGRPRNISTIVISQGYYETNKDVRENMTLLCCFKQISPTDKNNLHNTFASYLNKNTFDRAYDYATQRYGRQDPRNTTAFISIFPEENDPSLRIRKGFEADSLFDRQGRINF